MGVRAPAPHLRPLSKRRRFLILLVEVEWLEAFRLVVGVPQEVFPIERGDVGLEFARHSSARNCARWRSPASLISCLLSSSCALSLSCRIDACAASSAVISRSKRQLAADFFDLFRRHVKVSVIFPRGPLFGRVALEFAISLLLSKPRYFRLPLLTSSSPSLVAAFFHFAEAAVEHLDLLPAAPRARAAPAAANRASRRGPCETR